MSLEGKQYSPEVQMSKVVFGNMFLKNEFFSGQ